MRTSAFAVAIVVAANLVSSVSAEDDFSALLADLTFTDPPAAARPLAAVPEETLQELRSVPAIQLPPTVPSKIDVFEMLENGDLDTGLSGPQVALQDPVPSQPPAAPLVDLDAVFALQAPPAELSGKVVGHRLHPLSTDCQSCSQPSACVESGIVCRPRTAVQLPTSSLRQYFRSDPCYTNLWDGYHRKCSHHEHIHGICDCFNQRRMADCREVINSAPCTSCTGRCD
jgi:hypothetical protein